MRLMTLEDITKTYGEKTLFQQVSFTIAENERIGLVGVNGTGKSSLLKIIAGHDSPDEGNIVAPNDYRVEFLMQDPDLPEHMTVLEQVFHGDTPLIRLLRSYETALIDLEKEPENKHYQENLYRLQQEMDAMDAWDMNTTAKTVLSKLGIHDYSALISTLSGGQKKRVALARCLIQTPDLLILDEPTNHLDHASIEWLEEYLQRYPGSLLFVTHDRYFLDRVSNKIVELENGDLYQYVGNYEVFLEEKARREEQDVAKEAKRKNILRKELAWLRRGAKARTTKQKARIQRVESLQEQKGPAAKGNLDIALSGTRLGKKVFELEHITKSYDNKTVINDFSFIFRPEDRIGIVGANGTGKTTFMNILAGSVKPDDGVVEVGSTVKVAYYKQENAHLDADKRMITYITETADAIKTTDGNYISASQMLERFLFPRNMHGTLIGKLSGGEKRRLYLLKILMEEPNVLLLDEPTNDLDTQTLAILEDYLLEFPGCVVTVSHDRYFLDKVVTQLFVFEGEGKVSTYHGSFSDYLDSEKDSVSDSSKDKKQSSFENTKGQPGKKRKLSYMEQREWEQLEGKISNLEAEEERLQQEIADSGSDYEKVQDLFRQKEEVSDELEKLIERWTELSELIESLEQ